jgi:DNA-binding CsgD family transcriptional regulator
MDIAEPRTAAARCPAPPCITVQADGAVQAVNPPARRLLHDNAPILGLQGGRLVAADSAALQRCLLRAQGGQAAGLNLRRPGRLPLTLRAAPLAAGALHITLRDPEAEGPDAALLRELFALTPAEALVASNLALGLRTSDIAAGLGIQPNTVKAHLKSIYGKTGCRHQAALLSLVLRSAAMCAVPAPATHVRDRQAVLARLGIASDDWRPEE